MWYKLTNEKAVRRQSTNHSAVRRRTNRDLSNSVKQRQTRLPYNKDFYYKNGIKLHNNNKSNMAWIREMFSSTVSKQFMWIKRVIHDRKLQSYSRRYSNNPVIVKMCNYY